MFFDGSVHVLWLCRPRVDDELRSDFDQKRIKSLPFDHLGAIFYDLWVCISHVNAQYLYCDSKLFYTLQARDECGSSECFFECAKSSAGSGSFCNITLPEFRSHDTQARLNCFIGVGGEHCWDHKRARDADRMLDPHSEIELFGDRFCWNANELCNYVNGSSAVIEGLVKYHINSAIWETTPTKAFILWCSLVSRAWAKVVSEGPVIGASSNDRPQGWRIILSLSCDCNLLHGRLCGFPSSTGYISLSKTWPNKSSLKLIICCVNYQNHELIEHHSLLAKHLNRPWLTNRQTRNETVPNSVWTLQRLKSLGVRSDVVAVRYFAVTRRVVSWSATIASCNSESSCWLFWDYPAVDFAKQS